MKVVITIGDPAGCGPVITLKAIEQLKNKKIDFFVVGNRKILEGFSVYKRIKNRINLIDVHTPQIARIKKGCISELAGRACLDYLNKALEVMEKEKISRLVTAPLSKEAVQCVMPKFSGHTEYLAGRFNVRNFAMMMVSKKLKVVLHSRHIPLRSASSFIKKGQIISTLSLVYSCLQRMFKINSPQIALASFNPHSGAGTFLGREEKIIVEAIKEFNKTVSFTRGGLRAGVYGPFPSDSIFTGKNLAKYHCIVSCYHDQAMIPFKLLSFERGVNLTLGLPIIRTSPSHGVAYDIMQKKKMPFFSSMLEAIMLALKLKVTNY